MRALLLSSGIYRYPVLSSEIGGAQTAVLVDHKTTAPQDHGPPTAAEDHGTKAVDQFLTEGREGKEKAARVAGVDKCR